ncbi:unnamed protein product, partial [marine sediment metagenome]
ADGLGFASYKNISPKSKEKLSSFKKEYLKKIIACHDAELSRNGKKLYFKRLSQFRK